MPKTETLEHVIAVTSRRITKRVKLCSTCRGEGSCWQRVQGCMGWHLCPDCSGYGRVKQVKQPKQDKPE